jgi:hypothetical protein
LEDQKMATGCTLSQIWGLKWKSPIASVGSKQRDAGVYIELEAIALSREIPAAGRFVADPIVRRVSRNSLLASLQQTVESVRGSFVTVVRSAGVPASAQQLPNNCPAFRQHFRIRAPHLLKFIDSADWNAACLEANTGFTQTKEKRNETIS